MRRIVPTIELLSYFKTRPDMLIFEGNCVNAADITLLSENDNYVLIAKTDKGYKCCFSTDNNTFTEEVLHPLYGEINFCGVDPLVTEYISSKYEFIYKTPCYLYAWNGKPLPLIDTDDIQSMSPLFAQRVSDGTYYHASIEEINECLKLHPSAAIYFNKEPICWCLCHRDKSLGMLYTLSEYRNKGYALKVMTKLCNTIIEKGDIPFAYILTDNIASMNLAAKYNLVPIKRADYFSIIK